MNEAIVSSSVEEGLDFACSILSCAIVTAAEAQPSKAVSLLRELTQYIQLRYVGETLLALEYLSGIGRSCDPATFQAGQFWRQLNWVAGQMNLTTEELERLNLLQP